MTALVCTAVLIARDEERVIEACLRSVRGLVDEIIVLDTGSRDATRDIARRAGARVIASSWHGDFAAARNEAASHARGSWILSIDADERVVGGDRQHLLSRLSQARPVAYRAWLRPGPFFTPYRACRLFRNDPRIRFEGRIRESVLPSLRRLAGLREGARSPLPADLLGNCDLRLEHEDTPDVRRRKHARDVTVLEQALREDAGNIVYWTDLGRARAGIGDVHDALDAWQRAIDLVRRQGGEAPSDSLPYAEAIQHLAPTAPRRRALLGEAAARFPHNRQFLWLRAETLIGERNFAGAEPLLRDLVAAGIDGGFRGDLAYDRRIFEEFAFGALGTCCFGLRRWAEAAEWYGRAAAVQPSSLEYRAKRRLALRYSAQQFS